MAGGRPSKYDKAYCEQVIKCLAEGHSVTAFAGRIQVGRSSVFRWAEEHEEFRDALKVGQARATEFWEKILVGIAKDGGGNATAAIFGLKNRASDDWADKTVREHSGPDGGPIDIKVISAMEAARLILATLAEASEQGEKPTDG